MLKQRILTAIVAVVVLLTVLFIAPPAVARLVIGLLFAAAAWEWSGFLGVSGQAARIGYVMAVVALELILAWLLPNERLYLVIAAVAAAWWLAALLWITRFPTGIPRAVTAACGMLTLLPAYVALDWLYQESSYALLSLLLVVWLADIGAYFAGRRFGRVKLAPKVSPGKTWEGVFGGLLVVALASAAAAVIGEFPVAVLVPFCLALALLSVVGDLTVSLFKRHAGVKDSGRLFPGHGGILDRIDSVCAAAPLFGIGLGALGLR